MLTVEDLFTQNTKPGIQNISLKIYKDFYVDVLLKRQFHYIMQDDSIIDVFFWEHGMYHLMGIQHIDYKIKKENFISKINDGMDFGYFCSSVAMRKRFIDMIDRVEMFACIYYVMRNCRVFYVPTGLVKGTQRVRAEYVMYNMIGDEGMNIGVKNIKGRLTAITILADRRTQKGRHIDDKDELFVKHLDIIEISTGTVIESVEFAQKNEPETEAPDPL